jgi:hypothetical protein
MVTAELTVTVVRNEVGWAPLIDQPVNANPGYGYAFKSAILFAGAKNAKEDQ